MISWEYLAGFLDGDGWITSSKNKNCRTIRYTIGFTQKATCESQMKMICKFLNEREICASIRHRFSKTPSAPTPVEMVNVIISKQH